MSFVNSCLSGCGLLLKVPALNFCQLEPACCHLCCAGAASLSKPLGAQQQASPLPKRKATAHKDGASEEAAAADSGLSAVMGPYGLGANVAWREQVAGTAKLDAAGQSKPHLGLS